MADNGARPWFKFYPRDWRADEALRDCSMAARGLWIELMCLMHEATPYGHLLPAGRKPTDQKLAVQVGASVGELKRLLNELEQAKAFSRTPDGTIYSRRMVRDEHLRKEGLRAFREGTNPDSRRGKKRGKFDTTSAPPPQPPGGVASEKNGVQPPHPESRVQNLEDTPSEAYASSDPAERIGLATDASAPAGLFATSPADRGSSRATRLSHDWVPTPDNIRFGMGQGLSRATVMAVADYFRDYWVGKPGQKGTNLDWAAAWRNWIRRHINDHGTGPWPRDGGGRPSRHRQAPGSATAAARALLSEIRGGEAEMLGDVDVPKLRVVRGGLLDE